MPMFTRRDFLATTSRTLVSGAAGMIAGVPVAGATSPWARAIPVRYSARAANTFLPESIATTTLQQLATAAVDAARHAGASYVDVRVAERHDLAVGQDPYTPLAPDVGLWVTFTYGIRVMVEGQWMFAHGTMPELDAITTTARQAVTTARRYLSARFQKPQGEFVKSTVVTGTWNAPCQIDPFAVSLEEQVALLYSYSDAAERTFGGGLISGSRFMWQRESRTFASSEGSLVTQVLTRANPDIAISGDRGKANVLINLPQLKSAMGGYETVLVPSMHDRIKAASEEAIQLASLPRVQVDVGRYPVVTDGYALGTITTATLAPALEIDRALDEEADAAGGTFLAPPEDVLGVSSFASILNVQAGLPDNTGIGAWDDEGVIPEVYPIITHGRVVDYHTSRCTAGALRNWYGHQNTPLRSHGCAVATTAADPVAVRAPHLTITPAAHTATVDDLCKDIRRGLLLRDSHVTNLFVGTDQQFASGYVGISQLFAIEQGRIVGYVDQMGFQFSTRALWKSLMAVGDASTVRTSTRTIYKGTPWVAAPHSTAAPAAVFNNVNVVSVGRTL